MRRAWPGFVGWFVLGVTGVANGAEWPDLSSSVASEGGGENDAALIVGVEEYWELDAVPGAVANAEDWYTWLKRGRELPLGRAVVLRNRDATRERILEEAALAAERVGPGGTLWFVFIGHGASTTGEKDGLLVGVDSQQRADSVRNRGVTRAELADVLGQGAQEQTVLVLDACFSGKGEDGQALVPDMMPALLSGSWRPPARATVLSAARDDEFAGPLPGLRRPAFSYLVLGALQGWGDLDGDRAVTAQEAVDYARGALVELVRDRRQTPELSGERVDVVLSRGRERGPDLTEFVLSAPEAAPVPDPVVGHVETSTGGTDLVAAARELERLRADRESREAREKELEERLAAERRRAREEAEDTLRSDARSEWVALASLRDGGGPEAVEIVEMYTAKYGDATVTVDGSSYRVEIAQVSEAREWLERNAGRAVRAVTGGLGGSVIDAHGYEMVAIEAGEFWMGSPSDEKGRYDDETRHKVRLTRGFALGATEVTQGLYRAVMGSNPSTEEYKRVSLLGDDKPVQAVSWLDAVKFCNALSEQEGLTPAYRISGESVTWSREAAGYRLPTEAEWEYAARAGSSDRYAGTDSERETCRYANVSNPAAKSKFDWSWDVFGCDDGHLTASDVGNYHANGWGLYDMTGNVWEWAWDWYGDYPSGTVADPAGPSTGSLRVRRGGSWDDRPRCARVAYRGRRGPGGRRSLLGFRLARSVP
jgi:formylglycine-generating enzyme required for sulfatase activity